MEGQEDPVRPHSDKTDDEGRLKGVSSDRIRLAEQDRRILFWTLTIVLFGVAFYIFSPFLQALLTGIVLAVLMQKPYRWLSKRLKDAIAAALTVLLTAAILIVPFVLLVTAAGVQLFEFAQSFADTGDEASQVVEGAAEQVDQTLAPVLSRLGWEDFSAMEWLEENRGEIASKITTPLVLGTQQLVVLFVGLIVALFSQFFLLRDGHRLLEPAAALLPVSRTDFDKMIRRLSDTIHAVFQGFILVGIIQGALAGVLYFVATVPGAWFWMLVTMFFSMIPLIGPPATYIPISLYLFAVGRPVWGFVVLGVGLLVLSTIDNLLKPLFIGPRAQLHTLAVFFAILCGVLAFGPIGLMAGPLLLTVLLEVIRIISKNRGENGQDEGGSATEAPA